MKSTINESPKSPKSICKIEEHYFKMKKVKIENTKI